MRDVILLTPFSFIWRIPLGTENDRAEWRYGPLVGALSSDDEAEEACIRVEGAGEP